MQSLRYAIMLNERHMIQALISTSRRVLCKRRLNHPPERSACEPVSLEQRQDDLSIMLVCQNFVVTVPYSPEFFAATSSSESDNRLLFSRLASVGKLSALR